MNYEPLTSKEISILLARQLDLNLHPYTCMKHHSLYPTSTMWKCGKCEYIQKYSLTEMTLIRRT